VARAAGKRKHFSTEKPPRFDHRDALWERMNRAMYDEDAEEDPAHHVYLYEFKMFRKANGPDANLGRGTAPDQTAVDQLIAETSPRTYSDGGAPSVTDVTKGKCLDVRMVRIVSMSLHTPEDDETFPQVCIVAQRLEDGGYFILYDCMVSPEGLFEQPCFTLLLLEFLGRTHWPRTAAYREMINGLATRFTYELVDIAKSWPLVFMEQDVCLHDGMYHDLMPHLVKWVTTVEGLLAFYTAMVKVHERDERDRRKVRNVTDKVEAAQRAQLDAAEGSTDDLEITLTEELAAALYEAECKFFLPEEEVEA